MAFSLRGAGCEKRLMFALDGTRVGINMELPSKNALLEDTGSATLYTSPFGLVINDGDPTVDFTSRFLAEHTGISFQHHLLSSIAKVSGTTPQPAELVPFLKKGIRDSLEEFSKLENAAFDKLSAAHDPDKVLDSANCRYRGATTLASASLLQGADLKKLLVLQKGDSQVLVFRRVPNGDKFFYKPFYFSPVQKLDHNNPKYYTTYNLHPDPADTFDEVVDVQDGDVVVVGSNGLFDNAPLGFLSVLFNDMAVFGYPVPETGTVDYLVSLAFQVFWDEPKDGTGLKYRAAKAFAKGRRAGVKPADEGEKSGSQLADALKEGGSLDLAARTHLENNKIEFEVVLTPEQRAGWMAFLACPAVDQLSQPLDYGVNENFLSECVQNVLKTHFSSTADQVKTFTDPKSEANYFRAQFLARIGNLFAVIGDAFPTPYFMRLWQDGVVIKDVFGREEEAVGRDDDVVVATAAIQEREIDVNGKTKENPGTIILAQVYDIKISEEVALNKEKHEKFLEHFFQETLKSPPEKEETELEKLQGENKGSSGGEVLQVTGQLQNDNGAQLNDDAKGGHLNEEQVVDNLEDQGKIKEEELGLKINDLEVEETQVEEMNEVELRQKAAEVVQYVDEGSQLIDIDVDESKARQKKAQGSLDDVDGVRQELMEAPLTKANNQHANDDSLNQPDPEQHVRLNEDQMPLNNGQDNLTPEERARLEAEQIEEQIKEEQQKKLEEPKKLDGGQSVEEIAQGNGLQNQGELNLETETEIDLDNLTPEERAQLEQALLEKKQKDEEGQKVDDSGQMEKIEQIQSQEDLVVKKVNDEDISQIQNQVVFKARRGRKVEIV